jgi:hypothetical protein
VGGTSWDAGGVTRVRGHNGILVHLGVFGHGATVRWNAWFGGDRLLRKNYSSKLMLAEDIFEGGARGFSEVYAHGRTLPLGVDATKPARELASDDDNIGADLERPTIETRCHCENGTKEHRRENYGAQDPEYGGCKSDD